MARRLEPFFARYREDRPEGLVVVRGDLVGKHLLMHVTGRRLVGVKDFADVAPGDHVQDFLGVWNYGADAAARAVQFCDGGKRDPGFLAHSRNHFVRYEIDQLLEERSGHSGVGLQNVETSLDALLRLSENSL